MHLHYLTLRRNEKKIFPILTMEIKILPELRFIPIWNRVPNHHDPPEIAVSSEKRKGRQRRGGARVKEKSSARPMFSNQAARHGEFSSRLHANPSDLFSYAAALEVNFLAPRVPGFFGSERVLTVIGLFCCCCCWELKSWNLIVSAGKKMREINDKTLW